MERAGGRGDAGALSALARGIRSSNSAPRPSAGAACRDAAVVHLDDSLDQREPDAQAALGPGQRRAALDEQVEDGVEALGRNAHAVVAYPDRRFARVALELDPDGAAIRSVLGRVVDEVADGLLQPHRVAVHGHGVVGQPDLDRLLLGGDPDVLRLDRRGHDVPEIHERGVQLDAAAGDAGDVEQVVQQGRQVLGLALEHRNRAFQVGREPGAQLEDLHRVDDHAERIAQLVGQHRQELVLRLARPFGGGARCVRLRPGAALAHVGVGGGVHRVDARQAEAHVAADDLGQAALPGRERARLVEVDHELADEPAL